MKIPTILHQTWKSEELPTPFEKFMNTWKIHHPMWQHILWTDEMNRAFIQTHFPDFLRIYDSYSTNIQRVDAARYFILYHYGGVYVDMDFESLRSIEPILEDEVCVFGKEPYEHCRIHNKDMIISNAFIACTPRNEFIGALCREASAYTRKRYSRHNRILESTGPFMLTRLFEQYPEKDQVKILEHDILYPLTKDEIKIYLFNEEVPEKISEKFRNAYAVHYYWGTWWKKIRKTKTISILGFKIKYL